MSGEGIITILADLIVLVRSGAYGDLYASLGELRGVIEACRKRRDGRAALHADRGLLCSRGRHTGAAQPGRLDPLPREGRGRSRSRPVPPSAPGSTQRTPDR